jgi:DNA-directed RNA polymerase specialized sigma24 family protein
MEAVASTAAAAEAHDARALAGARTAFNSLYEPQFEAAYDFVLRVVGERELAADVVRDTFGRAWRAFPEQGNDVAAWLLTTARHSALDALRYRRDRNGAEREAVHFTRVDGNRMPDAAAVFDHALAELVWDTAAALPREDYSLLALHVRHGLSPEALGEKASARLTRTRDVFDERVTLRLMAERARHACTELEILATQGDEREIAAHIRRCDPCGESTRAFVSPAEVLGSLAFVEPEHRLRRELFKRPPRRRVFGMR